jgi:DNA-binding XRE family transcriptional regulator
MSPSDKPLVWLRGEVKTPPFSAAARVEAGGLLRRLQRASGWVCRTRGRCRRCHELRIGDAGKIWRVVYRLDGDAVVIAEYFKRRRSRRRRESFRSAVAGWPCTTLPREETEMDARKRKRLEAAGWRVGSAAEFLGLSAEEAALVETRLAVSGALRQRRERQGVTQAALAKRLRSSQSRVAKMEAGDPSISLDLLLRAFFATGATKRDLARVLTSRRRPVAA